LAAWPSIRPGAFARGRDQVASIDDASRIDGFNVRAVPWLVIGPGALMLLVGLLALTLPTKAPRHDEQPAEPARGTSQVLV
jgi:hypothetical protein